MGAHSTCMHDFSVDCSAYYILEEKDLLTETEWEQCENACNKAGKRTARTYLFKDIVIQLSKHD